MIQKLAQTFRQWQKNEIDAMQIEYAGNGYTRNDYAECRTESDYWRMHLLPWLESEGLISYPVTRWLAQKGRLKWCLKHFQDQMPRVDFRTGNKI